MRCLTFEKKVFDPRSPTLGIRRSPLSKARLWTFETQEPIVTASMQTVEKQKEEEFIIERAASVVAPEESLVAAVLPDVDAELVKLRQEFSAKKENAPPTRTATPIRDAKMFLSSPALWKTLTSSPQLFEQSPKTVSDPLLPNNNWQMHPGSRRTLFSRSDSASAA